MTATVNGVTYEVQQQGGKYIARPVGSNIWGAPSSNAQAAATSAAQVNQQVSTVSSAVAVESRPGPYYETPSGRAYDVVWTGTLTPVGSSSSPTGVHAVDNAINPPQPSTGTSTATVNGVTYEVQQQGGKYIARPVGSNIWGAPSSNAQAAATSAAQVNQQVSTVSSAVAVESRPGPYYETPSGRAYDVVYDSKPAMSIGGNIVPDVPAAAVRYAASQGRDEEGNYNLPMPDLTSVAAPPASTEYGPPGVGSGAGGFVATPPSSSGIRITPVIQGLPTSFSNAEKASGLIGVSIIGADLLAFDIGKEVSTYNSAIEKANVLITPFDTKWENKKELTPEEAYSYTMEKQALEKSIAPLLATAGASQNRAVEMKNALDFMNTDIKTAASAAHDIQQVAATQRAELILSTIKELQKSMPLLPETGSFLSSVGQGLEAGYVTGVAMTIATGGESAPLIPIITVGGGISGAGSSIVGQATEWANAQMGVEPSAWQTTQIPIFPGVSIPVPTGKAIPLAEYFRNPEKYLDYAVFSPIAAQKVAGFGGSVLGAVVAPVAAGYAASAAMPVIQELRTPTYFGESPRSPVDVYGGADNTGFTSASLTTGQPMHEVRLTADINGKTIIDQHLFDYPVGQPIGTTIMRPLLIEETPYERFSFKKEGVDVKGTWSSALWGSESQSATMPRMSSGSYLYSAGENPFVEVSPRFSPIQSGTLSTESSITTWTYGGNEFDVTGKALASTGDFGYLAPTNIVEKQAPTVTRSLIATQATFTPSYEGVMPKGVASSTGGTIDMSSTVVGEGKVTLMTDTGIKDIDATLAAGRGQIVSFVDVGNKMLPVRFNIDVNALQLETSLAPKWSEKVLDLTWMDFSGEGQATVQAQKTATSLLQKGVASIAAPSLSIETPLPASPSGEMIALTAISTSSPVIFSGALNLPSPYQGPQGQEVYDEFVPMMIPPGTKTGTREAELIGFQETTKTPSAITGPVGGLQYAIGITDTESRVRNIPAPSLTYAGTELEITGGKGWSITEPRVDTIGLTRSATLSAQAVGVGLTQERTQAVAELTDVLQLQKSAVATVTSNPPISITTPFNPEIITPGVPPFALGFFPMELPTNEMGGLFGREQRRGRKGGFRLKPMVNLIDVFTYEAKTGKEFVHYQGPSAERGFAAALATGTDYSAPSFGSRRLGKSKKKGQSRSSLGSFSLGLGKSKRFKIL